MTSLEDGEKYFEYGWYQTTCVKEIVVDNVN